MTGVPGTASTVDTLIVVCCHAIYIGGPNDPDATDENKWLIEPFQSGEVPTFISHIEEGVRQLAQSNGRALLTFSGGATKRAQIQDLKRAGKIGHWINEDRTEAQSYYDVAKACDFFDYGHPESNSTNTRIPSLRDHILLEPFATDSYQNILLSILQFPILHRLFSQHTSNASTALSAAATAPPPPPPPPPPPSPTQLIKPPYIQLKNLIIISHEFKRARFMDLHIPAISALLEQSPFALNHPSASLTTGPHPTEQDQQCTVQFIGINPPFDKDKMAEIEEGDRKRGYGVWKGDVYGTGKLLSGKRLQRGWDEELFLNVMARWFGGSDGGENVGVVDEEIRRIVSGGGDFESSQGKKSNKEVSQ